MEFNSTNIAALIFLPMVLPAMVIVYWQGKRAERKAQEQRAAEAFSDNWDAYLKGQQHG